MAEKETKKTEGADDFTQPVLIEVEQGQLEGLEDAQPAIEGLGAALRQYMGDADISAFTRAADIAQAWGGIVDTSPLQAAAQAAAKTLYAETGLGASLGKALEALGATKGVMPAFKTIADSIEAPLRRYTQWQLRDRAQIASREKPAFFNFPYAHYSESMALWENMRDMLLAEGADDFTVTLKEDAGINYEAWKEAVRQIPADFEAVRGKPSEGIAPAKLIDEGGRRFSWSAGAGDVSISDVQAWCDELYLTQLAEATETDVETARAEAKRYELELDTLHDQYEVLCALCALGYEAQLRELLRPSSTLYAQDTKRPTKHYSPNSKLANVITNPDMFVQTTMLLDVAGRGEKKRGKEIVTAVSLSFDEALQEGLELSRDITPFDRAIHDAMSTLWVAGNRAVTPSQIWKAMAGTNREPSKKQTAEIMESVDKQRRIMAKVDYTQEARGRKLAVDGQPVTSFKIERHLIEGGKVEIETANRQVVIGYNMAEMPVLYEHAAALGQVISYPQRLLDTSGAGSNTERNIAIKKYLLRRIGMMKGKQNTSNRIKYESIYTKAAGISDPDRKTCKAINDFAIACMKLWKDSGHIEGYREYKEGQKRAGIEVCI